MSSHFYPPSRPRPVEGGIKARSTRGDIAQTWWGERFIAVLAESGMGGRLQRGKSYARKGQVISLDLQAGVVNAVVQGSRVRPYRVRIGVTAFGKAEWAAVEQELAGDAWYLARLLAGEMPDDIEQVFARLGLRLFPAGAGDLSMDCTCPDWSVPCKHLAAAIYLLAETREELGRQVMAVAALAPGSCASDEVDAASDRLEVCGVDAGPHAAEVVEFEAFGDGADLVLVDVAVRALERAVDPDGPVAVAADGSGPDPTAVAVDRDVLGLALRVGARQPWGQQARVDVERAASVLLEAVLAQAEALDLARRACGVRADSHVPTIYRPRVLRHDAHVGSSRDSLMVPSSACSTSSGWPRRSKRCHTKPRSVAVPM